MTIVFLLIFVPFFTAYSIIFYQNYSLRLNAELTQSMDNSLTEIGTHLSIILDDVENISRAILYNNDVQDTLRASTIETNNTAYENAVEFIGSMILYRDHVRGIAITNQSQEVFSVGNLYSDDAKLFQKEWYQEYIYTEQPFTWITENSSACASLLTRRIKDNQNYITILGKMAIYIDSDYIQEYINKNVLSDSGCIFLIQPNKEILLASDNFDLYKDVWASVNTVTDFTNSKIVSIDGTKYLIGNLSLEKKNWHLVEIVPYNEINQSFIPYRFILLFSIILVLAVFLFLFFFIAASISAPIRELSEFMSNYNLLEDTIPENYVSTYGSRKDETGIIFKAYLRSIKRTRELINEVYVKDIQKTNAELAVLEHQIHPHFLYNTLDSINWLALRNEQDEISEMISALSNTFRISLRKTNSPYVTVQEELEHIRLYLVTLKHRYGNRFSYSIDVPEIILQYYMMRMTLQPLIENAILHGIEPMQQDSMISLSVEIKDSALIIIIRNSCLELNLDKINLLLSDNIDGNFIRMKEQHGYGINNINSRIHLLHGNDYGISYRFCPPNICHCKVRLPIITQTDYDEIIDSLTKPVNKKSIVN